MDVINKKIKYIRKFLRKTQDEFAKDVDTSRSNIALIETGKATPSYELLKALTDKHGIEPSYYFDEEIEYEKSLKNHQNKSGDHSLSDKEKELVAQWIARDRANKYYHLTKELATKISAHYEQDINSFFSVLNEHWKSYMIFMQFISQYDRYFFTTLHLELFKMANEKQYSKEQLHDYTMRVFDKMKHVTTLVKAHTKDLTELLVKAQQYDIDNTLNSKNWLTAIKAELEGDYVTGGEFLKTFDLVYKNYPQFPHTEFKE